MLVSSIRAAEVPTVDDTYTEGVQVVLHLELAEIEELLAAYDPTSGTSPSIGDCRPVLRSILNAYLEAQP